MQEPRNASEMTQDNLETYVRDNSQHGDPDSSLQDWIAHGDLDGMTMDDVVAEWDSGRE